MKQVRRNIPPNTAPTTTPVIPSIMAISTVECFPKVYSHVNVLSCLRIKTQNLPCSRPMNNLRTVIRSTFTFNVKKSQIPYLWNTAICEYTTVSKLSIVWIICVQLHNYFLCINIIFSMITSPLINYLCCVFQCSATRWEPRTFPRRLRITFTAWQFHVSVTI